MHSTSPVFDTKFHKTETLGNSLSIGRRTSQPADGGHVRAWAKMGAIKVTSVLAITLLVCCILQASFLTGKTRNALVSRALC